MSNLVCDACGQIARGSASYCGGCGKKLSSPLNFSKTQASFSRSSLASNLAESYSSWMAIVLTIVVAGLAIFAIAAFQDNIVEPGSPANQEDNVRACNFFRDGFLLAMSENGSAYGMRVWREAAEEGAKYAEARLAFELRRFAGGGPGSTQAQLNINELCP